MAPRLIIDCPAPPLNSLKIRLKVSAAVTKLPSPGSADTRAIDELKRLQKSTTGKKKSPADQNRAQALLHSYRDAYLAGCGSDKELEVTVFNYLVVRTSIELMKVVLHSMISSILYIRELLPLSSLGARQLPICIANRSFCYEEHFMSGGFAPHGLCPRQIMGDNIMVMERGKDSHTDELVNWLEGDVMACLLKRRLMGIQLSVCNRKKRCEVFETYTISIEPTETVTALDRKRSRMDEESPMADVQHPKENRVPLLQVKEDILAMIRRLSVLSSRLSTLPNERQLLSRLFSTETYSSMHLSRDDLISSLDQPLCFPNITGGQPETFDCCCIDTGFYSATLQVTYSKPPNIETIAGTPNLVLCGDNLDVQSCESMG